jgi:HD-GYP domain-containing protein (c-di-GMP phosphodiesterase class II)
MADIISALSYALDLTEGQPLGHSIDTCILGMRLAAELSLSTEQRGNLYYALLLKDAGCSSNASRMCQIFGSDERQAKLEVKTTDWTRVSGESLSYLLHNVAPERSPFVRMWRILGIALHRETQSQALFTTRCERGADVARKIGFSEETAQAIRSLDEHWDGHGYPDKLRGNQIPLFAQIAGLCQTLEVYARTHGRRAAFDILEKRSGKWFNPELVRVAKKLESDDALWEALRLREIASEMVQDLDPGAAVVADEPRLDNICEAFGEVIDAKSPFTQSHSKGVAAMAVQIAERLGVSGRSKVMCRRAALLHDLGKLGVPNTILDKPGKLDALEWEVIRMHPLNTQRILEKISCFSELAFVAGAHHEKLDGSGYPHGLKAEDLPLTARIIAVADIYDALAARRPYRDALPIDQVVDLMSKDVPHRLDPVCFDAMVRAL